MKTMNTKRTPEACDEHDVAWCGDRLVLAADEGRQGKLTTTARAYTCTGCRGPMIVCRFRHRRYIKRACFRHKTLTTSCKGGGPETQLHYQCKYYMQEYVGCYYFSYSVCTTPDCSPFGFVSRHTDIVKVETPVRADGKSYVYDVLVFRGGRPHLVIEIMNTHKTDEDKITWTRQHGIQIVEVHVQDIVQRIGALKEARRRHEHGESLYVTLPNLLQRKEMCDACCTLKARNKMLKRQYYESECYQDTIAVARFNRWLLDVQWKHACEQHPRLFESCRLNRKRKLQRLAFRLAEQRLDDNELPHKKPKYEKGQMRKCPECDEWVTRLSCEYVRPEIAGDEWFNKHRFYEKQKFVSVCDRCVIPCEMCYQLKPLSQALQYGLCRKCNTETPG